MHHRPQRAPLLRHPKTSSTQRTLSKTRRTRAKSFTPSTCSNCYRTPIWIHCTPTTHSCFSSSRRKSAWTSNPRRAHNSSPINTIASSKPVWRWSRCSIWPTRIPPTHRVRMRAPREIQASTAIPCPRLPLLIRALPLLRWTHIYRSRNSPHFAAYRRPSWNCCHVWPNSTRVSSISSIWKTRSIFCQR